MYVCNCNGIRETELRTCARMIEGDPETVYLALGHRPQCGLCLEDAAVVIEEARALARQPLFV